MYKFILDRWKDGTIDAAKVASYCPTFITEAERDEILATPQT